MVFAASGKVVAIIAVIAIRDQVQSDRWFLAGGAEDLPVSHSDAPRW
jgi:hypothetical protein